MAWITFVFDHLMIMYIVLYTPSVQAYEGIINTFFMLSGAVLGAYIGFSTWDDVSAKRSGVEIDTEEPEPDGPHMAPPPPEAQADTDER